MNILSNMVHGVEKVKKSVKENYKYYKMGKKAEYDEEVKKLRKSNIKRLKGY